MARTRFKEKFIILLLFLTSCVTLPTSAVNSSLAHSEMTALLSQEEDTSSTIPVLVGLGAGSLLMGLGASGMEDPGALETSLIFSGIGVGFLTAALIVYLAE